MQLVRRNDRKGVDALEGPVVLVPGCTGAEARDALAPRAGAARPSGRRPGALRAPYGPAHPGNRRPRERRRLRATAAGVLAAVLLSGCAQSVDPIERLGRKAAQGVQQSRAPREHAYRHWGLPAPLAPAPRPYRAPGRADGRLPRVLDRVPTRDRVVFLVYGDGPEDDPRFAAMIRELRLPVSVFLTGRAAGPRRARVARLRAAGAAIQNQTLDRAALRGRPYREQRAEICGQRDRLRARLGVLPRLLRPPGGRYDRTTLRAAAACGIKALILWRPAPGVRTGRRGGGAAGPRAGDIVLAHDTGRAFSSPTVETTRLLRRIQARGFAVGRLEDYL
ncbi:polysaccharide deacetylase family protein [Streptomyces sp. NPDC052040]|uniref:polysaccharide deacetylase family protein n=1 Tax=Streptomyces sp. NPDC052040 TaxID=3365682 RepID=UPI0037CD8355